MSRFSKVLLVSFSLLCLFFFRIPQADAQMRFFDQQLARLASRMYSMESNRTAGRIVRANISARASIIYTIEDDTSFRFVVLGDTQTPWASYDAVTSGEKPPFQSEIFRQIIDEINVLNPAFTMEVGDLILGYNTPELLSQEWDVFGQTAAAFRAPYLSVTGNHDISHKAAAEIWRQRMGPFYYSFDYGNCHFISLFSEEAPLAGFGDIGVISPRQLGWLATDLEQHKDADSIFVFLHKPFFLAEEYLQSNWEQVHTLLKEYPVRAVFSGHFHQYRYCGQRDGIDYVITGGGGNAELRDVPRMGEFNHYLLVQVNGKSVDWAVIKPGAVLPPEVITQAMHDERRALENSISFTPEVAPFADAKLPATLTVTIANPTDMTFQTEVVWELPLPAWKITPASAAWTIPAHGAESLAFTLGEEQVNDSAWLSGPLPSINVEMPFLQGKELINVQRTLGTERPTLPCVRTDKPPAVDGSLIEWQKARPIWIGYPGAPETWTPDDIAATLRLMWDDKYIYIAAEVWDDDFKTPQTDVRTIPDDALGAVVFGGDSVSAVISGFDCTLVQIGDEGHAFRIVDNEPPVRLEDAAVQVVRQGNATIYEAALPIATVLNEPPQVGDTSSRYDAGAYWHDCDGEDPLVSTWQPLDIEFR